MYGWHTSGTRLASCFVIVYILWVRDESSLRFSFPSFRESIYGVIPPRTFSDNTSYTQQGSVEWCDGTPGVVVLLTDSRIRCVSENSKVGSGWLSLTCKNCSREPLNTRGSAHSSRGKSSGEVTEIGQWWVCQGRPDSFVPSKTNTIGPYHCVQSPRSPGPSLFGVTNKSRRDKVMVVSLTSVLVFWLTSPLGISFTLPFPVPRQKQTSLRNCDSEWEAWPLELVRTDGHCLFCEKYANVLKEDVCNWSDMFLRKFIFWYFVTIYTVNLSIGSREP